MVDSTGGMTDEVDSGLHTYTHICVSTHTKVKSSSYMPCLERISSTLTVVLTKGPCLGQSKPLDPVASLPGTEDCFLPAANSGCWK